MFNSKKIQQLENLIDYMEHRLERCERDLAAVRPPACPISGGVIVNSEPSLYDLVKAFKATHVKVDCHPHWIPKKESK